MQTPNIKVYIIVSGILVVLFFTVTFIPFSKKTTDNQLTTILPTPTSIESNRIDYFNKQSPTLIPAQQTGVYEEELPAEVINLSVQKQELRSKIPFDTGLFQIDFDYGEDKFIVTLAEPKSENRIQFDKWVKENYPSLGTNQFNFK